MTLAPATVARLIAHARSARRQAWAPYSGFAVGAAVLAGDGRIFLGCNVENASYGLTVCAERNAVAAAVVAGQRPVAVAVVTADGDAFPCGACRQVLAEFDPHLPVVLAAVAGDGYRLCALTDLLPGAFRLLPSPGAAPR